MLRTMGFVLLCVLASHTMVVANLPPPTCRVWVTTNNNFDSKIVDRLLFTSSTSVYLWANLPHIAKGSWQQVNLSCILSGVLEKDDQVRVNESSAVLAVEERMMADSFTGNNHEYVFSETDAITISSMFETFNGINGSDGMVNGNNGMQGTITFGKRTFSDLQPSVD